MNIRLLSLVSYFIKKILNPLNFHIFKFLIILAATNMPNSLDTALTRAGRFDKKISLPYPSQKNREDLFKYFLKKIKNVSPSLDISSLSHMMIRKTGADVKNLVNQAALLAIGRDGEFVEIEGKYNKILIMLLIIFIWV